MNCGSCGRAWTGKDGRVHCGAPVDDAALAGITSGVNPIWAERKYGDARLERLLTGQPDDGIGMDCENMDPMDGENCKMWKAQP